MFWLAKQIDLVLMRPLLLVLLLLNVEGRSMSVECVKLRRDLEVYPFSQCKSGVLARRSHYEKRVEPERTLLVPRDGCRRYSPPKQMRYAEWMTSCFVLAGICYTAI